MKEEFKNWCNIKNKLSKNDDILFLKKRDIRWVYVWENLWFETNWKWIDFTRPVLVLKVLNKNSFIWIPLSSQIHSWTFFSDFIFTDSDWNESVKTALLNQVRIFSNKRVEDLWWKMSSNDFSKLKKKLWKLLWII